MKKVLSLLMLFALTVGMVGCGSDDTKDTADNKTPTQEENKKEISFDAIKAALKENGYEVTKESVKAATMIGGLEGYSYETAKGKFEFYSFDKSSEAYKNAEKDGIVTLEGFGDFKVVTNNGFLMMSQDVNEDVVKIFKSL